MKDFIVISIALSICVHINVHQYGIIVAQRATNEILEDQITDYAQQISDLRSRRTYSDGVRDGISDSKNQEFVRAYHLGINDGELSK